MLALNLHVSGKGRSGFGLARWAAHATSVATRKKGHGMSGLLALVDDVAANRTILERNLNSWGCG